MSLVVAQATANGPRIASDTHFLAPRGRSSTFKDVVLKATVLREDVCICFAGEIALGLAGVRRVAAVLEEGASLDSLPQVLASIVTEDPRMVEFIVAGCRSDQQLWRITRLGVEEDLRIAWIGDEAAFEAFQRARYETAGSMPPDDADQHLTEGQRVGRLLGPAMEAVINDAQIPSVHGFCVSVACTEDGFRYMDAAKAILGRSVSIPSDEETVIPLFQPVQDGAYHFAIVPPRDPGVPALGISFANARLAFLLLPLQFDEPEVITDVPAREFVSRIRADYGIEMNEPMIR